MKPLWILGIGFLFCLMCCCGILALLGPSSATPKASPSSYTTHNKPASISRPVVRNNDRSNDRNNDREVDPVLDRFFEERTQQYELQLAAWEARKLAFAKAETDLAALELKFDSHELRKPLLPTFEQRQWSTWDKKFTTNASLISTDNKVIRLKKSDGKEVEVSKDALIASDRIYIEEAFKGLSSFNTALATWTATRDELTLAISSARKRIEVGVGDAPKPPIRSEIKAEIAAREAERSWAELVAKERADANARAHLHKRNQDRIDIYSAFLSVVDPDDLFVDQFSIDGDRLTLTVTNTWHFLPYQMRLQQAQVLWEGWATLHSPSKPDSARIILVDRNGNKVGGSRVWGGSLIWVQDK